MSIRPPLRAQEWRQVDCTGRPGLREVVCAHESGRIAGDAAQEILVIRIGGIVGRLGSKYVVIEVHLYQVAGDAEILKAGAQKGDRRHEAIQGMFGDGLADHAVGRDHVKHIEPLNRSGRQSAKSPSPLVAAVAGNMGICGAEGDDRFEFVILSALRDISAFRREFHVSLGFDLLNER